MGPGGTYRDQPERGGHRTEGLLQLRDPRRRPASAQSALSCRAHSENQRMTQSLINLVAAWGYIAIFVTMVAESAGLPISSEIVVPLGGALASQVKLGLGGPFVELVLVVLVSTLANLTGSLIAFWLTRRYGERVVLSRAGRRLGLSRGHLRLANRFFDRFGLWAVFLGRLLPIVRTYISFPSRLSRLTYLRFMLSTPPGPIPWNFALAYAGYNLGQHYETG